MSVLMMDVLSPAIGCSDQRSQPGGDTTETERYVLATCNTMRSLSRMNDAPTHNVHAGYDINMRGDHFPGC